MTIYEFSPDDAVTVLDSKLHIKTVRRTILNYEHNALMERAKRSVNGREAFYSKESLAEFYASWNLLHGDFIASLPGFSDDDKMRLPPKFVSYVREMALREEKVESFDWFNNDCSEEIKDLSVKPNFLNLRLLSGFRDYWKWYKQLALIFLDK